MVRNPRQLGAAFTLLELVFVLMVLALVLALTAPHLRGWGQGANLRSVADEFRAATVAARAAAILSAQPHRLEITSEGTSYQVVAVDEMPAGSIGNNAQTGEVTTSAVTGEFAAPVELPAGYRVELIKNTTATATADSLEFDPTGRITPATVRITSRDGRQIELIAESITDNFHLTTEAGS